MMTSSNENIFCVTGPLCWEFTGPGDSPDKGQWRGSLMFSLICAFSKQSWGWWFETPSRSLWRHWNGNKGASTVYWPHLGSGFHYSKPYAGIKDMVCLFIYHRIAWAYYTIIIITLRNCLPVWDYANRNPNIWYLQTNVNSNSHSEINFISGKS